MDLNNLVYDVRKSPCSPTSQRDFFTVDEYYRMTEAGILTEFDRVERIDGESIEMSPIGFRHAECVNRANAFFMRAFGQKALVSVPNPLRLTRYTEPHPDIVVLKPRDDFYSGKRFGTEDVLLVVESQKLPFDTTAK
jgi:Uma2 family endonuclease